MKMNVPVGNYAYMYTNNVQEIWMLTTYTYVSACHVFDHSNSENAHL